MHNKMRKNMCLIMKCRKNGYVKSDSVIVLWLDNYIVHVMYDWGSLEPAKSAKNQ